MTQKNADFTFRHYQGEQDLLAMLGVLRSAPVAGEEDQLDTLEDFTHKYRHPVNCDPFRDVWIAEAVGHLTDRQMVAYGRVTWWQLDAAGGQSANDRIYHLAWYIRPEWCGRGLEEAFLHRQQERTRQIIQEQDASAIAAGEAPFSGARLFEVYSADFQPELCRVLEADGFQPAQQGSKMTCFDLDHLPDVPMPAGLEVRPAKPEHYRQVWDAMLDAFRDHWNYREPTEADYASWQQNSHFQPQLWQVAWEGDQVVGMVLNYIAPEGSGAPVAWTEDISVRRPWRRRGLARALLARSMRMFRAMGYTQTSLGVDLHHPQGADQFYSSMGYQRTSVMTVYRKPVKM